MTWIRSRWIRILFGAAIWAVLIITVIAAWEDIKKELSRAGLVFPAAVVLITAGLLAAARGWAALQPVEMRRRSMVGFLAAQPAKYLPVGGAVQAVGQVGLTTSEGRSEREVAWSFLIHAGVQVAAAALTSLLVFAGESTSGWVKLVIASSALAVCLLLRKSVVASTVQWLSKLIPRISSRGEPPSTRSLVLSAGWTIVPLLMSGLAFGLLLGLGGSPDVLVPTIGVFAAAWVVGFVVFPLPSGIGAREAVLVALIPSFPTAQILGVSLLHRFSTVVAELILLTAVSKTAFLDHERSR